MGTYGFNEGDRARVPVYSADQLYTKDEVDAMAIVDVSHFVNGGLSSYNIADAISRALLKSKYIHIPSGHYVFNMEIETDVEMFLEPDTVFESTSRAPVLYIHDCSVSIHGGIFKSGDSISRDRPGSV